MKKLLLLILTGFCAQIVCAQPFMANPAARNAVCLNGRWDVIVDPFSYGGKREIQHDYTGQGERRFIEYSFDGRQLEVPGDWNSQGADLLYYENSVWYRRYIDFTPETGKRSFLWFGAANYRCDVFLNGEPLGSHEGGFSPFEFETTGKLKSGRNVLIARVDCLRDPLNIPAMVYDWWNYGGLTRDVYLVTTPQTYIRDYFVRLDGNRPDALYARVMLAGPGAAGRQVKVSIPELKFSKTVTASADGTATFTAPFKPQLWSPADPKLYAVEVESDGEKITDRIGFRTIAARDGAVWLNGSKVFLKGINCHDEIPMCAGRSCTEADARMLLEEVKALGCNFLRLTHYPATEHMVRLAEQMGIMLWEEVPLWQGIAFSHPGTLDKANGMLTEMIARDKNRCAIILWSVANETRPGADRNAVLEKMIAHVRTTDASRLVTAAFSHTDEVPGGIKLNDPVAAMVDVIGINKYFGWYVPWGSAPKDMVWQVDYGKPVIFSEFGSESLYGNHGPKEVSWEWYEEYQAQNYRDNIALLPAIPNLAGTTPWVLYDFRSPYRMNAKYQQGWNRKGLISDRGYRKMAWYVLKEYYDTVK